jgi:hypothetical protein
MMQRLINKDLGRELSQKQQQQQQHQEKTKNQHCLPQTS